MNENEYENDECTFDVHINVCNKNSFLLTAKKKQ